MTTIHTMSPANVLTLAEMLTRADAHGAGVRVAWDGGLKVKINEDMWTPLLSRPEAAPEPGPVRSYPFIGMTPASFDYAVEMGEAWLASTVHGSRYDFRVYLGPIPRDYQTDHRTHGWTVVAVPSEPARASLPDWRNRKTTVMLVHLAEWDEDLSVERMAEPNALAARLAVADLHIVSEARALEDVPAFMAQLLAWRDADADDED